MIATLLLIQAAAAQPVQANVQLACTVAMPGAAPVALSIDLKTKKPGVAALAAAADGPFARVSASTDAVRWPDEAGAVAFGFATGQGQYRVELVFAGDFKAGNARARIVSLGTGSAQPTVGQGYCTARSGKPLVAKKLVRMPFDATPRGPRPSTLAPLPAGLGSGGCRIVAPDRRVHEVGYTVLSATGNEASVAYKFDDPAWLGMAGGTGTGVQFHLASPSDRLVVRTVRLAAQPPMVVRTSFERSGTWIDITRGGAIVAQGECGPAIAAILTPMQGK